MANLAALNHCTCGCSAAHILARRQTFDGWPVHLWSDGGITYGTLRQPVKGTGISINGWSQQADLTAGWALMGEVSMLDHDELPKAVRRLRNWCRKPYEPSCSWRWANGKPSAQQARNIIHRGRP